MKLKQWTTRDKLRRQCFPSIEIKRLVLKSLLANATLPWNYKFYWTYFFQRLGLKCRLSFFRNSCLWTGRGRSVFRLFKFSRHWIKHFASKGWIAGMRKSSF